MQMAPGSAPYVYLTSEDNTLTMLDFVNEANKTTVKLIHDEVCAMKVCSNGLHFVHTTVDPSFTSEYQK